MKGDHVDCDKTPGCGLPKGHAGRCQLAERVVDAADRTSTTARVETDAKHRVVAPKKLIEVALPLDEINKAAAREKSIRHGHPSTLHLWWARRPLAAARAVLFAQLVNDPSWKYSDEDLKKPAIKGAITKKRNELFRLITELVQWESTTNERVLERARAEIRASWRETCEANRDHPEAATLFNPDKLPEFHDPFAGGGALPLEAQRLGLLARATDLNPVAVLINKAMIEIPPNFAGQPPVGPPPGEKQVKAKATEDWSGAKGLAEDVRRYGVWIHDEATKRIGHLYPKIVVTKGMVKDRPDLKAYEGETLTVIAWLWARTVRSPNPAFADVEIPLTSTFMLSTKSGKESWVEPIVEGRNYRFSVKTGTKPPPSAAEGTKAAGRGADFLCLLSGSPVSGAYIKSEAVAGRMGARLMAVVAEGDRHRLYLPPTREMEQAAAAATPVWKPDVEFFQQALGFRVGNYGMTRWSDLFTPRQLVALTTLADLIVEVRERVRTDAQQQKIGNPDAYADAVSVFLAFAFDKVADGGSSLCRWMNQRDSLFNTFAKQALSMVWDFAEINTLADCTRSWTESLKWTVESIAGTPPANVSVATAGQVTQMDATTFTTNGPAVFSTDPPYYDNIGYADLSDFFYVWLRRILRTAYPDLFATITVPKAGELVATPARHGGREAAEKYFLDGMGTAMARLAALAHPTYPATIYYAFKQADTEDAGTSSTGWDTFLSAVAGAGLSIVGTWPVRTERSARSRDIGSNALASSIVLVCRRRELSASTVSRRDFIRELERVLPAAIAEMTADPIAGIAPVDLAQACIGPGMAIYSKYAAVLEADGSPMSVNNALVHINKAVDEHFAHAEGDLDADSRFCIGWFEQRGFDDGPFGEADVLARAKGTSVDGVKDAGVIEAGKGKVRLFKLKELPRSWDPTKDTRIPTWEALHHMCRALGESEGDAGALLAKMQARQDSIRQLAYRLYTLCERKGWAEHARAYNDLITSWPEIVKASQQTAPRGQIELV